ncbi:MAG TPA: hypothetical protein DDY31_16800, partial [Lachnospiraceae bacterium]|nr:hypothetical protein [Lachnospiraceae bacterium]
NVYVNNVPAQMDTKVYDNFTIQCDVEEQIPSSYIAETFVSEESIVSEEEEDSSEGYEEETDSVAEEETDSTADEDREETEPDLTAEKKQPEIAAEQEKSSTKNISIVVNGEPVVLRNKADYIFVDVLDFYPFDTSVARGDHLELRVNGIPCDFTHPVKEGDQIQIEWVD